MNLKNITFFDEGRADGFLNDIGLHLNCHGCITVADVYDLAGLPGSATRSLDEKRLGWTDVSEFRWVRDPFSMSIDIRYPDPVYLYECDPDNKLPNMVEHPPHYQSETGLEVIDVIQAFTFDLKGIEATDTGNVIKYICRWKSKNGLEDLKKARWYLNHLINHVEKLEE